MSEYFESVKKKLDGKLPIQYDCHSGYHGEYYIYDDKKEASLCITPDCVKYKGYTVPLNESEVEDLYNMAAMRRSIQEEKNKKEALKELKGEQ